MRILLKTFALLGCILVLLSSCASHDALILVDEKNFTIAETDRYFVNHLQKTPLNTFRHSRSMSSKDNQFVVRENQDVMYSHAVVDVSQGATFINPSWDVYSVIQVIDENQYTVATIYPGEQKTISTADLTLGQHVFLNMRAGVRTLDQAGYEEAHKHQDNVQIIANGNKPYEAKGFDQISLTKTRKRLKSRMLEANQPRYYFGTPDDIEPTQFLIASAVGIFGLPVKDAAYLNNIQPSDDIKRGIPAKITIPKPPLNYAQGGFFSVSTYAKNGWIATDNFALNHQQAKPNADGSYTFYFNAPYMQNNIDVVQDWAILIRLYMPNDVDEILDYIKHVENTVSIEPLDLSTMTLPVNKDNYIRAETDHAFTRVQLGAGGQVNEFLYFSEPTPLDKQTVVRMNLDTLYAGAIVDTAKGATVTIPAIPDNRYYSVFVVDNDHYSQGIFTAPGTYQITSDTRYAMVIQRIQIFDPNDLDEVATVAKYQRSITINANSAVPFVSAPWDHKQRKSLKQLYESEFRTITQYPSGFMDIRGKADESLRHLAAAGAWGLFPEAHASYINYTGPRDSAQCYTATYQVPENNAFWSLTVYGGDGYMHKNNNMVNSQNVKSVTNGVFDVYFGSEQACGDKPNRLDTTPDWSFLLRVYHPGRIILDRQYKLPDVVQYQK